MRAECVDGKLKTFRPLLVLFYEFLLSVAIVLYYNGLFKGNVVPRFNFKGYLKAQIEIILLLNFKNFY